MSELNREIPIKDLVGEDLPLIFTSFASVGLEKSAQLQEQIGELTLAQLIAIGNADPRAQVYDFVAEEAQFFVVEIHDLATVH